MPSNLIAYGLLLLELNLPGNCPSALGPASVLTYTTGVLRSIVFCLLAAGLAWASPAQDLFDQATVYLVDYYGGFSRSDVTKLIIKY